MTRNYLLCTTQRTGSSLLCSLLGETGVAGMQHASDVGHEYLKRVVGHEAPEIAPGGVDVAAAFREGLDESRTPNGVGGIKVMWSHLSLLAAKGGQRADAAAHWLPAALPPDTKYVWLTRQDTLRQAISQVKAVQSQEWSLLGERSDMRELTFDHAHIRRLEKVFRRQNRKWRAFFREAGIAPLHITYEGLAEDHVRTVQQVLDFAGVRLPESASFPVPKLRRQSDAVNEEWAARARRPMTPMQLVKGRLMGPQMGPGRYPDFMIIGVHRGGTTWLWGLLRRHPEIWFTPRKELHYFDSEINELSRVLKSSSIRKRLANASVRADMLRKAMNLVEFRKWHEARWLARYYLGAWDDNWYASLFAPAGRLLAGEATPAYSMLPVRDVERIAELMPRLRVILSLRNPIERAWSHIRYDFGDRVKRGEVSLEEMKQFVDSPFQTERGNYLRTLDAWTSVFAREQVHVTFFDGIADDPRAYYDGVINFLNVAQWHPKRWDKATASKNSAPGASMPPELRRYLTAKFLPMLEELADRYAGTPKQWLDDAVRGESIVLSG